MHSRTFAQWKGTFVHVDFVMVLALLVDICDQTSFVDCLLEQTHSDLVLGGELPVSTGLCELLTFTNTSPSLLPSLPPSLPLSSSH